jgi:DNA repair exonuclease SbcCD ATPase subunit
MLKSSDMEERKNSDKRIICRQCGREFVFSTAEQEFYEQKGWNQPRRCKECRAIKRDDALRPVCSQCGAELDRTTPTYCGSCHASDLASTQLENELSNKQKDKALEEARSGLEAMAAEKGALEQSLSQKEQTVGELQQEVESLKSELQEVRQLHTALDRWFQPALSSLEEKMEERLEAVENRQDTLFEKLSQLTHRLQEMKEGLQKISLLELIKRSLGKENARTRQKAD